MTFSGRPQTFEDQILDNGSFLPSVSLGEFQKLHRVPSTIADDAVAHQVTLAMGVVNRQLVARVAHWQALGHLTLAALDAADSATHTADYKAAVYYRAKANLLADFQTFSRRDVAENQATERHDIRQALLAEAKKAVKRLCGSATSIGVELL